MRSKADETFVIVDTIFRSDLLFFFNNLNVFPMNSNSFIQVRVQQNYFFEFKFKFGKMIEFFQVRVRSPGNNASKSNLTPGRQKLIACERSFQARNQTGARPLAPLAKMCTGNPYAHSSQHTIVGLFQ